MLHNLFNRLGFSLDISYHSLIFVNNLYTLCSQFFGTGDNHQIFRRIEMSGIPLSRLSTARKLPATIPSVTYRFYGSLWDRERGRRFRDLPAFRGFVGYQVRLITTLIANCNGYQLEDPVVIAQANFPLRESDLFEMQGLLEELEAQGLVSSDTAAVVATEIEILRERLFDDVNV